MFKSLLKTLAGGAQPSASDPARDEAQQLVVAGNAAEDAGQLQQAHDLYRRAAALAPGLPAAHLNLGIAQEALGDAPSARASYERVLALQSDHPFGAYNLGKLDFLQGHLAPAEALLRRALAAKSDFPQAWMLLSSVLEAAQRIPEAADAIAQAVRLQPDHAGALYNQSGLLRTLGRIDEAEAALARCVQLDPNEHALARHNELLLAQGFARQSLVPLRQAIALAPHRADLRSRELFILNLVEGPSPRELFERHRQLGEQLEAVMPPLPLPPVRRDQPRLRVGLVSEDFRFHPVAQFLLPWLEHRDRARFEVVCYSSTPQADALTQRVRGLADRWMDVVGWHDKRLAEAIAADAVDILLDLGGHTGVVRLGAFAARPAPVQLSWVGYLNTSGLSRLHYRVTDARCDPPALSQPLHTERLLYLPHSQWCFRPLLEVAPAAQAPCERQDHITFGSFNNGIKLDDPMLARWGGLLRAVPGSRLLVAGVGSTRKRESMVAAMAAAGVAADRIEFAPRTDLQAYYRLMDRVDIALDSEPYGGGTTTFDALWMGVPVLATRGDIPAARSAASVLGALGLDEWVAGSRADWEALAVARAADRQGIAHLRRTLRDRLRASPLMDEPRFAADFQALLEQAWAQQP